MGLCNLYQYQTKKTVKLSDAYSVDLYLREDDFATASTPAKDKAKVLNLDAIPENYKLELFNCTDVTLPSFKYKTEIYKYGNNEKTFLIPDYSSLDDLSIELMEYYDKNDNLVVQQLVNLFLNKLFNTDTFSYRMHNYIDRLDVNVYDNNFSTLMYTYTFKYLKLTNYTKYDLDYSSNNPAKWKLSFSYMEYQAIPKGTRTYNLNGENDPNVSTAEPVTETNVDFAEMYKAIMAGRAGRAPSDSTSMLTPNAYNNNSDDIAALKPQVKKLSQNIENQQAHVAAAKAKVKELEDKITEAEATLNDPMFEKRRKEAAAGIIKSEQDMQKYDIAEQEHNSNAKDASGKMRNFLGFVDHDQIERAADEAVQGYFAKQNKEAAASNLELYKQEAAELNAIYEQNTNNIAEWKAQLAQEKQNLDNLNRGFNNLTLDYNNKLNELSEMENLKKDQIASLENRYGSMNSLSQQDFNANRSSYAESMSQASRNANDLTNYAASMKDNAKAGHISDPYTEKEEALARGEHNLHETTSQKASELWSNDQSEIYNQLHNMNESNKISMEQFEQDNLELSNEKKPSIYEGMSETGKQILGKSDTQVPFKPVDSNKTTTTTTQTETESEPFTVYTRSDKILKLTQQYEQEHPEWSDEYIYEHASNVVDTELTNKFAAEENSETIKKQTQKTKPNITNNVQQITLSENDIEKYVPFLYKPVARSYFNKYKNDEGQLTLMLNEDMIDQSVPALFRATAKDIYHEYMADHPGKEN